MGDEIVVEVFNGVEAVQLYCHSSGIEVLTEVQSALSSKVGRDRWDDNGYLTRIIFQKVIGPAWDSTGFGIYPGSQMGGEYPNIQVYPDHSEVRFGESKWTFSEFCDADIEGFAAQWWEEERIENYKEWIERNQPPTLSDVGFRSLLNTYMINDVAGIESWQEATTELVEKESKVRGYDNWVVAYHEFVA